ncbi:MAG: NAD(+)/NADH kinase [Candidatus Zixiibacteriota bacterium]
MNKIGIIANVKRPNVKEAVSKVLSWAEENNKECFLCSELSELFQEETRLFSREELRHRADCIFTFGGDGTMLATARAVGDSEIPILGVNMGSLGFLTQVPQENFEATLQRLKRDDFQIEDRMVLECRHNRDDSEKLFALNDVVIDKGGVARIIHLHLSVGEEFICTYNADGLIISTPTGSTAYSLAAGGPILSPQMKAIIADPICPHTVTQRPMVFPHSETLEVKVESPHDEAVLTVDGQVAVNLKSGDTITIREARHTIKLITFPERSFYEILRTKLHWGVTPKVGR